MRPHVVSMQTSSHSDSAFARVPQATRKAAKSGGAGQVKHDARHGSITKYVAVDAAMPSELYALILYHLSIFVFMCCLPFSIVMNTHFIRFMWAVRPNFAKQLSPSRVMYLLAHDLLDEACEETTEITDRALTDVPGRPTLGMDGHKEGKHRHVETITRAKLGLSTFAAAVYMRTTRTTGKNLANVALKYLSPLYIAIVADNTGNNTGENTGVFAHVRAVYTTLFCLGCYVHVFDLLIEDVAKLPQIKAVGNDAHFCVSFLKKHGLLFEEFLICQQKLGVKHELVLFPATRFAYLFLMIYRVQLNVSVMRLVAESATFTVVKAATRKRGEEGKKAMEEFNRFESLVETRNFRVRLQGGTSIMEPFSIALHYGEGDSTPLSHVFPLFQYLYDFSQQLGDFEAITDFMEEEDARDAVSECVRKRWLGEGRLVGLRADVHLLAFVFDPFVQGALTTAAAPDCDLLTGEVLEAARKALRHFSGDNHTQRAVLSQQFMLWNAAAPRLPDSSADVGGSTDSQPVAQVTGNNAFSALRLDAMHQVWSKQAAREDQLADDGVQRDEDSAAFAMREAIAKLRFTSSPVEFWLAMMNETPRGASVAQKEAHMLFCKSASDISGIVGHTCGVERAGKAYKQVLTQSRKRMDETRALKAIFVFLNYNLREHRQSAGDAFSAFASAAGLDVQAAEKDPVEKHALRRGSLIMKDVMEDGSESEGEEGNPRDTSGLEDDCEEGADREGIIEVQWYVPDGFEIGEEPTKLDASLVGAKIYMRWEIYGWQLGQITGLVTSATPRLFLKFNFRVFWSDNSKGPTQLAVDNYGFGVHAQYNSWCILTAK